MDIVISARVPEEELEILKKKKKNISEIVRTSIIEAAEKEKLEESLQCMERLSGAIKKIDRQSFLRSVRGDRDETH